MPSYHIEETAIKIFYFDTFSNFETSIRKWFNDANSYLESNKFKSQNEHDKFKKKLEEAKNKLNEAKVFLDDKNEAEAKKIWKEIFQKEFPITDEDEAKNFSKLLSEGSLKIGSSGTLSATAGKTITASKGFFGDVL